MVDFHDDLATLCAREMNAALKSGDADRAAGVITSLATMLGRSCARLAGGDGPAIDTMLVGAEELAAGEAAGMAGIMALAGLRAAQRGE